MNNSDKHGRCAADMKEFWILIEPRNLSKRSVLLNVNGWAQSSCNGGKSEKQ